MNSFAETIQICPKCNKQSSKYIRYVFDSRNIKDIKTDIIEYLCPKCENCGNLPSYPGSSFVYIDRKNRVVYYVFPEYFIATSFNNSKNPCIYFFNEYLLELVRSDKEYVSSFEIRYIEYNLFLKINKIDETTRHSLVHFIPEPEITIDLDSEYPDSKKYSNLDLNIERYQVGYLANNLSDSLKDMINEIHPYSSLMYKTGISVKQIKKQQNLLSTLAIPEIILFLGSNILLPLVLSILANLIFSKLEKRKIRENDTLRIVIKVGKDGKEYIYQGNPKNIAEKFKNAHVAISLTTTIDGDCHVANKIDNVISDVTLREMSTYERASDFYCDRYNSNTGLVFFYNIEDIDYLDLIRDAFENKNEAEALTIIRILIESNRLIINLELTYNLAVFLKERGYRDLASHLFELFIARHIMLPNLKDLKYFTGPITDEEITKTTEETLKRLEENKDKLEEFHDSIKPLMKKIVDEMEKIDHINLDKKNPPVS